MDRADRLAGSLHGATIGQKGSLRRAGKKARLPPRPSHPTSRRPRLGSMAGVEDKRRPISPLA